MGEVTGEMAKDNITIRRGNVNAHRNQEIVERFHRTLDERPFTIPVQSRDELQRERDQPNG